MCVECEGVSVNCVVCMYVDVGMGVLHCSLLRPPLGQVHKGMWRGTPVAVKRVLNQKMGKKIVADFCSEVPDRLCRGGWGFAPQPNSHHQCMYMGVPCGCR
jgi:hypothetical protein